GRDADRPDAGHRRGTGDGGRRAGGRRGAAGRDRRPPGEPAPGGGADGLSGRPTRRHPSDRGGVTAMDRVDLGSRLDLLLGDATGELLAEEIGVRTVGELLRHYPRSYAGFGALSSAAEPTPDTHVDRKSTRLNSSHVSISYAVFCLKKKTDQT